MKREYRESLLCSSEVSRDRVRQDLVLKTVKVMSIESHHDVSPLPSRSIACRLRQRTLNQDYLLVFLCVVHSHECAMEFLHDLVFKDREGDEY